MQIRWTDNRREAVAWLMSNGPATITEAMAACEAGDLDIKPTSIARVFYDGEAAGIFAKVGGAYYPTLTPSGSVYELRLVKVQ